MYTKPVICIFADSQFTLHRTAPGTDLPFHAYSPALKLYSGLITETMSAVSPN